MRKLDGKKIAILATHGFEESEFVVPKNKLEELGAIVEVISLDGGEIKSWSGGDWSESYTSDKGLNEAKADDYMGLVLPGGVMNPDKLRMNPQAVEFVNQFFLTGKPIAAICHGPWTLIETKSIKGMRMTSYPSLKSDLVNAGVEWVDEEVVVDAGLVTSRNPDDLPAFCEKMVEEFRQSIPEEVTV